MALILTRESSSDRNEKNKQQLSEKRKKRYAEDAEYRQHCLEASRKYRRGERTPTTPPEGFPISFEEAAKRIDVGKSTLYEWRNDEYFPEPKHYNGRRLWFSEKQVLLLKYLKDRVHGRRRWYGKVDRFKDVIAYVKANWN